MELGTLFLTVSMQLSLPPGLLSSICYVESRHKISAVHVDDGDGNSLGICQIKYKTAQWLGFKGTEQELMKPEENVLYAGRYLAYNVKRYHDVRRAVIAYNFGNARGLTTTKYQRRVFKEWEVRR
jgi:soluble lytic murein transglycosylase-like protein